MTEPPNAPRQFSLAMLLAVVTVLAISLGLARWTVAGSYRRVSIVGGLFDGRGGGFVMGVVFLLGPFLPAVWITNSVLAWYIRPRSVFLMLHVVGLLLVPLIGLVHIALSRIAAGPSADVGMMFGLALSGVSAVAMAWEIRHRRLPADTRVATWLALFSTVESYLLLAGLMISSRA